MNEPEFERGTGQWAGVVMIIRPDLTRVKKEEVPMCDVVSARTVQLNGRRAICTQLPYAMFTGLFRSTDEDHIFCEAEFTDGHLEVFGKARTNLKEWVLYSQTVEQQLAALPSLH